MKNIILLHGALGSANDLKPIADALTTMGFNVYNLSFSGHGEIPFDKDFGIEQFAEEIEGFIRNKELTNVSVFGYSMGGFVALYLALKQKDLIERVITLGTKFNWSKETVDKETRMLDPKIMLEKIPAFVKSLEAKHGVKWEKLVLKTAVMMKEIEKKGILTNESLKTINTPVLIGLADKDQMVTIDETVNTFKSLPNGSMYMLPKSKHQIESVNTNLLANIIVDFIGAS